MRLPSPVENSLQNTNIQSNQKYLGFLIIKFDREVLNKINKIDILGLHCILKICLFMSIVSSFSLDTLFFGREAL